MIHLAPIKYANCFESDGGPIESIEESKVYVNGERYSISHARLSCSCRPHKRNNEIFEAVDGIGVDRRPGIARNKSISAAIQRWAFLVSSREGSRFQFGFDRDSTTNGMAAFPGVFEWQARRFARQEAIKRFSLIAWWDGVTASTKLVDSSSPIQFYLIDQPFRDQKVVIARLQLKRGYSSYGCGSSQILELAKERAICEMERTTILLDSFYCKNPGFEVGDLSTIADYCERRVIYFSTPEGSDEFDQKISGKPCHVKLKKPDVLFDGAIRGPWSTYASVWRVVYEQSSYHFLDPAKLTFLW